MIEHALLARPLYFSAGAEGDDKGARLALRPLTLGKVILNAQILRSLGVDEHLTTLNPLAEALRLAEAFRPDLLRLIALNTLERPRHALDEARVRARVRALEGLTSEDVAQLLITILELDNTHDIVQASGICHDLELRQRLSDVKADKGQSLTLGGRTLFGSLLDQASQRYGWTPDYILWGVPYVTLKLMLADAPTALYLTDDEAVALGIRGANVLSADDPDNLEALRAFFD